jgi:hypothetical protein
MLKRSTTPTTNNSNSRVIAAIAAIAVAAGVGTAVVADSSPPVDFNATGTYQLGDDATVTIRGITAGHPVNGPYVGTVAADDGSLPAPGDCEPASATLRVTGTEKRFVDLVAFGDICGVSTDTAGQAAHVFTGRYDATGASPSPIPHSDGFYEVRIADNGTSSVLAIDT